MSESGAVMQEVRGFKKYWIDESLEAPVDVGTAFAVLSDFERWPSWAPGIKRFARLAPGPLRPGSRFFFTVQLKGMLFPIFMPCRFYRIDQDCIEWGLGALGNDVRHRFELTAVDAATTRVRHVEYASNAMALVAFPIAPIALRFNQALSRAIARKLSAA